jgi:hypothetical protein
MRHKGGLCSVCNIFRYMQVTLPLPLYILIYDIQYSKEGCLLPRTRGWTVYTCHLQGSQLLKARTYPSSVKRSLYKCRWILTAIGYVRVRCRVYTFISLSVSSLSVITRIRTALQNIPARQHFWFLYYVLHVPAIFNKQY